MDHSKAPSPPSNGSEPMNDLAHHCALKVLEPPNACQKRKKTCEKLKTLQNSILLIVIVGLYKMNTYNVMLNTINYMSVIYYVWLQNQSYNLFLYVSGFAIIT